jgi:hypothetical protein
VTFEIQTSYICYINVLNSRLRSEVTLGDFEEFLSCTYSRQSELQASYTSWIYVLYSRLHSTVTWSWLVRGCTCRCAHCPSRPSARVCAAHVCHDSFIFDVTHSHVTRLMYISRDSFMWDCLSSLSACFGALRVWHDSFLCDMCDMTHFFVTCLVGMW